MAIWDIPVSAVSGASEDGTASGNNSITASQPGDIDNATINSIIVLGTPSMTSDSTTDDTIQVYWWIEDSLGADTYGSGNTTNYFCEATLGDSVSSDTITKNTGTITPAPSGIIQTQWDQVSWAVNYTKNGKDNNEACSWNAFTIRVDYTPASTAPVITAQNASNISQTQADVGFTTDTTAGTGYYYISTSATPPSATDLKNGTGAVDSGNSTVTASPHTFRATGLTANTSYYAHYIQNEAGEDSNIDSSAQFTTNAIATDSETFTVDLDYLNTNTKSMTETITYLTNLNEQCAIGFDVALSLILQVAQQEQNQKIIPLSLNLDNTLDFLLQNVLTGTKSISYDVLMNHVFNNNKSTQESILFDAILDYSALTPISGSVNFGLVNAYTTSNTKVISEQFTAGVILTEAEQVSKLLNEAVTFNFTLLADSTPFGVGVLDDPVYSAGNYIFVDLSNILISEGTIKAGSVTFTNNLGQQQTVGLIGQAAHEFIVQLAQLQSVNKVTTESQSFNILNQLSLATSQLLSFTATLNLDQLQTNQATALKSILYNLALTQDQTNVKTTANDLTLTSNLDLNAVNQLLANTSISFGANLDYVTSAGKDIQAAISYLTSLDFDIIGNVSITVPFGLQMAQTQQVKGLLNSTINLINTLDAVYDKQMVANKAITYLVQLQAQFGSLEGIVATIAFAVSLDKTLDVKMTADKAIAYLINLTQEQQVTLTTAETLLLTVQLLDTYNNTKTVPTTTNFNLEVQQLQTNLLNKLVSATFSKTLNMIPTGQVDFKGLVEFSALMSAIFVGDAAGSTSGFISFGLNLDETNLGVGTYTRNIAFDGLLDLLNIAGKNLTESLTITVQLDQDQAVDLTLEGFIEFQSFYNKLIGTQAVMRPSLDFDLQLLDTSTANKNTLSSILLNLEASLIANNTRTVPGLIQFALQQSEQTEIRLIGEGRVTLATELAQSSALQLLGQSGITFGHLLGLASLSSAVRDESISFGTIQDFSTDGFVIQFTISTPDGRTLKIYFEDRIIIVDEEDREIKIYPDFRSNQTIN